MKFGFKLSNIQLGEVSIGGIEVNTELSINEMVAIRKETEIVLKKMPEYLNDLAVAVRTFEEIDDEMREEFEVKCFEQEVVNNIKRAIMNGLNK